MEQLDAEYKDKEEDVNAQSRRVLLLENEATIQIEKLATTVLKLALMSKDADNIVKVSFWRRVSRPRNTLLIHSLIDSLIKKNWR